MAVNILVVDDEPDVFTMIQQEYENQIAGTEVNLSFALNGQEALKTIEQQPFIDIVLTDINMPVMDGLELLTRIKNQWPLIKVIVISAYDDMGNIRKAMNQGAFDFITKPIEFPDLEKTISNCIQVANENRIRSHDKLNEHNKLLEIEKELEAARNIQSAFIPQDFALFSDQTGFEIYGKMEPAKEVGGDFFDFFLVDDSHIGLVIADVSGKGIPAALFMTMTRAALRCFASQGIEKCLQMTNEFLCDGNDSCMFVTLFYCVLNINTKELQYCNAGHNPPLVISENGHVQEIGRNHGLALGVRNHFDGIEHKILLKDHDSLVFYTDGVTEALNAAGGMFTETRLKEFLSNHSHLNARELASELMDCIQNFVQGAEQSDDITVFCIKLSKPTSMA